MLWALSNIKALLIAAALSAAFSAGWYVEARIAAHHLKSALAAQQTALLAKCAEDKKLTTEVSHDYQTKIASLNSRLNALRMHPAHCVPVTGTPSGRNAAAGGVDAGQNAVPFNSLIDYAGEAEQYRLQLVSCQEFIKRVWK